MANAYGQLADPTAGSTTFTVDTVIPGTGMTFTQLVATPQYQALSSGQKQAVFVTAVGTVEGKSPDEIAAAVGGLPPMPDTSFWGSLNKAVNTAEEGLAVGLTLGAVTGGIGGGTPTTDLGGTPGVDANTPGIDNSPNYTAPATSPPSGGGSSPVPSWLAPAIQGVAQLGGAAIQANAASNASQTQAASTAAALDYAKQLDTYARQQSANRYATLAGAMGMSTSQPGVPETAGGVVEPLPPTGAPPPPSSAPAPTGSGVAPSGSLAPWQTPQPGMTTSSGQQPQTVTMLMPDGTTQQVPLSAVPSYVRQGATQVTTNA